MNTVISVLMVASVALAGSASYQALSQAHRPMGISQQQFHDNCAAAGGRYGALSRQVVCTLTAERQVICQFDAVLGNCLWTGAVGAGTLSRILSNPANNATAEG